MYTKNRMTFKKGFSLVEVMIAIGMMTAGSLALMQMQTNNVKMAKSTETSGDINANFNSIVATLQDVGSCTASLKGESITVSYTHLTLPTTSRV